MKLISPQNQPPVGSGFTYMQDQFQTPISSLTTSENSIVSSRDGPSTARTSQWEETNTLTQGVVNAARSLFFGKQNPQPAQAAEATVSEQSKPSENLQESFCFRLNSKIDPASSSELLSDKWEALKIAGERLGSTSSTVCISNIESLQEKLRTNDNSSTTIAVPFEDRLVFLFSTSTNCEKITYYDPKTKELCTKEQNAFKTSWLENKWAENNKASSEDIILSRNVLIINTQKQSQPETNDWENVEISANNLQEMLLSSLEIAIASEPPQGPLLDKWTKLKATDVGTTHLSMINPTIRDLQKALRISDDSSTAIVIPFEDRLVFACSISQESNKITYYDPKESKQISKEIQSFEKSWKENTWLKSSARVDDMKLGRSVLIVRTKKAEKTSTSFPSTNIGWENATSTICAWRKIHKPSPKLQEQYKMALEEARIANREKQFINAWDQSAGCHRREGYQGDLITIKNLADIQKALCSTEESPSCLLMPFTSSWIVVCSVSLESKKVLYLMPDQEEWGMRLVEEKFPEFLEKLASSRETIPEDYRLWARRLIYENKKT